MKTSKRPVRAAIVGLGMGRHHIDPFRKHPHCEVAAVCDVDAGKVRQVRREFDIEHGFTSHEDLLDFGEFDVAAIVLPNDLHEPVTIEFLEAGKHVLAEKPLALNAQEGQRIVAAAKKAGVKAAMHMNQRFSREHQVIRRAIEAGDLGDIRYIRTGWMRKRGIPTGAGSWFVQKRRSGGGALIDLGVHMLDSALWFCDFPDVIAVAGRTHRLFAERDLTPDGAMDVEDFAVATLRCAGGLTIHLEVAWASFHDESNEAFMHVYGTRAGAHRRTRFDVDWNATGELCFSRRGPGRTLSRETIEEWPGDLKTVQEDLIDAIIEDRAPRCQIEEGLLVQRVLDAVYRSAESDGLEVVLESGR